MLIVTVIAVIIITIVFILLGLLYYASEKIKDEQ